jgi:hypothetical protein
LEYRTTYAADGHHLRRIATPFTQGQIDYIELWSIEIAPFLDNLLMSMPADHSLKLYKYQRRLKSTLESSCKGLIYFKKIINAACNTLWWSAGGTRMVEWTHLVSVVC